MDVKSSDNEDKNDSPASSHSEREKASTKKAGHERYRFRSEREEGEIESDADSSNDGSPVTSVQISSEGLFNERVHRSNAGDSASENESKRQSSAEEERKKKRNADSTVQGIDQNLHDGGLVESDIEEISRDAPEESLDGDSDHYKEVKLVSSSDEEMSSAAEEHHSDSDEKNKDSEESDEASSSDDDHSGSSSDGGNDFYKQKESEQSSPVVTVDDDSDEESVRVSSGKGSEQESTRSKKDTADSKQDKRKTRSDSESDIDVETKKPKSLIFKKTKKSGEKTETRDSDQQGHTDGDVEEVVVDHLDIAAPQQALLRKSKNKEKKRSSDRGERLKQERSDSKERKKEYRDERSRGDSRDKERRSKYDDHDEKRYKKYEKHESSKDHQGQRPRPAVDKKRAEEDLRRKALQKRPREEHASRYAKEERKDISRKEEKYKRKEKSVKEKEDSSKVKKEARERQEDLSGSKTKSGKEVKDRKEQKKEKESSGKGDKVKKRRREKSKSNSNKDKGSDSSEEETVKEKNSKRPRSSDREIGNEVAEAKSDDIDEHVVEAYDDISPASSEIELSPPPSPVELKKPTYYPAIMGCRDVRDFQWLNKIEEGTYGVVYRARDNRTNEIVALKRLKMEKEKEGFPITSLREINTLLKAQHPNIVTVREIVVGSNMDKIYIVMDYVEHDLKSLMETMKEPFLVGEVKTLMIQLLRGVNHMHDNWILHRDIKASNLLLSHKGILKIGDFGLAREYGSPLKSYTPIVVTLWYRAPELLLGGKEYKCAIDLWSVGCVFAELLLMKPLFPGKSEIDQINRIFKELGTPNDKIWPGPPCYSEYSMVKKTNFASHPYNKLRERFGATFTDKGFNLLNRFLTYDPQRRITAEDALEHEYFEESPLPVDPSMFPTWPAKSELAHRAVRKHNASPKAPEGGGAASKVANDDQNIGFHMPAATKGFSAKGAGFNLKF